MHSLSFFFSILRLQHLIPCWCQLSSVWVINKVCFTVKWLLLIPVFSSVSTSPQYLTMSTSMKFSSCAHLEAPQPATKALICLFLVGLSGNFCVEGRQIGAMESGTNLTSLFSSTMAKSGLNVSPKTHPERILDQEFLSLTNFMNPFLWKSF